MHKNATKCNKTQSKWCVNKHGASKIIDTFETYHKVSHVSRASNEEAKNLSNIGSQCLPIPPGVFWEEIIERSIKSSKSSTPGEPSQHPTTGLGAGKPGIGSTAKPEEVMMVEET
jgi:hypothetical protein